MESRDDTDIVEDDDESSKDEEIFPNVRGHQ